MAEYDPAAEPSYDPAMASFENGEYQYDEEDAEEEDEDYDPSNFQFDEGAGDAQSTELMQADQNDASNTGTPAQNEQPSRPKTVGGFIVEDDEDEDEEEQGIAVSPPSQLNVPEGAQPGLGNGSMAEAAAQDVPIASEPQDTAAVPPAQTARPHGSTPVVPVSDSAASAFLPPIPDPASAPAPSVQSPVPSALDQGKHLSTTDSPAQSATATPQPPVGVSAAAPPPQASGIAPQTPTTPRLPHDKVGQLEDRIKEDPRGDTEAWRSLITHYREKGQLDNARKIYTRFFEVFPSAATMWVEYAQMELEQNELQKVEQIFGLSLLQLPNVDMWNVYLDYLRRIHPLINDTDGQKRGIITQAFDLLLDQVGIDPDAGKLWREYVDFVKSGPGMIGGSGWQDTQKQDTVRKAYQRAIKLPHSELTKLWKEYDNFELSQNKATGRKFLQEQSPHYMTARTAKTQLDQRIDGLDRKSLPKLPPLVGYAGADEYDAQLAKWRSWVAWEKEDPLVFKEDDIATFRKRVVYAYKQATMQLRFFPNIWFEAAIWCYEQSTEDMTTEGDQFLDKGIEANPESALLATKKVDRVESGLDAGNTDEIAIQNGKKLDVIFENVHKPLYALHKKTQEKMSKGIAKIQESYADLPSEEEPQARAENDNDSDDGTTAKPKNRDQRMKEETDAYRASMQGQLDTIKKTISYVWASKLRAFRRIQGQGHPGKEKKGLRGVFAEARPRGQLSPEVYIASAQMEWRCYKDASAGKIFDRGAKLFPTDEKFALEFIKYLISDAKDVMARATFETTITKIVNAKDLTLEEQRRKCRTLFVFMHEYESMFGDLDKIHKLEKRMAEMFPEETEIERFSNRNLSTGFDAVQTQLVISPTQAIPRSAMPFTVVEQPLASIEQSKSPPEANHIRLGPNGPYVASPKRPLDDSDSETPQRKFIRGDSPLKGAAGRRIQTQAAAVPSAAAGGGSGFMTKSYVPSAVPPMPAPVVAGPQPLPKEVIYMLSILPSASQYKATYFDPHKMVDFLRNVNLSNARLY